MGDSDESTRFLAVCEACDAVYAATETAGGDVIPIGSRTGCRCGGTSFSRLEDDSDGGSEGE